MHPKVIVMKMNFFLKAKVGSPLYCLLCHTIGSDYSYCGVLAANPLRKKFDFALEQEEEAEDTTSAEIDQMAAALKKQEVSVK